MDDSPRPLRMLVVDDDDIDRERIRRLLARTPLDVEIVEAASGAQGLALARANAFDCVVLDNHLGDIDGVALMRQLRTQSRQDCPIIFVTGAGNEELAVHALLDGAADYLSKATLNSEVLVRAVRRGIEHHQLRLENEMLRRSLESRVVEQAATIRQRERDLYALIENSPTLMSYWDADQRCRFGNARHTEWLGIAEADLCGTRLAALLGDALYASFEAPVRGVLAGHAATFECQVVRTSGAAPLHAQVRLIPDIADGGRTGGFYLSMADVGPQKAAQERIEELLAFSDAVIQNSPIGIAVFAPDGRCVLANASFAQLCDEGADSLRLQAFWQRPDWRDGGLVDAALATLRDGSPRRCELTLLPHGRAAAEWACALTRVDRSGVAHLLLIASDVGEQRRAHAALVEARDAAQSAARAKSAFLANMSHEIRTPMNAIVGLSRVALDDDLTPTTRAFMSKVHGAAIALMALLDDVLDYSKIDAGHLRIEPAPFALEEALARCSDLFQARIAQKDLHFELEIAHDVPARIVGDALRLSQVLNNLVGNAVKFTERGTISLRVDIAREDGRDALRFTISDTGIGIAREHVATLFGVFVQADSTITARFGGTGLGLAICKRLVELMGGHIGVDSTPGRGSDFWFTLALAPGAEAPESPALLAGTRLLVVQADAAGRAALAARLRRLGAQVDVAATLQSALAGGPALDAGRVDALVFDGHRPEEELSGQLARLRERLPRRRVIALASATQELQLQALLAAGLVDAVVPKPLAAARLADALASTRDGAPPPPVRAAARHASLEQLAAPLRGARVLLVEDNPLNQIVAAEMLRRMGIAVEIAADGSAGVQAIRATAPQHFSAVLMDLHMPVLDGLEATRRIRGLPAGATLPIIGMTAAALPEDRVRCLEAGMTEHVSKPVLPERLVEVLRACGVHGGAPPQPAIAATPEAATPPGPGGSAASRIDLASLHQRCHGDERLMRTLLDLFMTQERDTARMLDEMVVRGDIALARHKVHELKGSAGSVGALATQAATTGLDAALVDEDRVADRLRTLRNALDQDMLAMRVLAASAPGHLGI